MMANEFIDVEFNANDEHEFESVHSNVTVSAPCAFMVNSEHDEPAEQ